MIRQKFVKFAAASMAIACVLLYASTSWANVSLRNGNFYMGYKDIVYPGGFEPKIERVYNSKTGYKGIFGWGWGTEYEVYLTVSADGSVVVHEYGGGAENRFTPVKFKRADLVRAVDRIVAAAKKVGGLGVSGVAKYKKKLLNDSFFRNDEWEKLIRTKGSGLKPRKLAAGTKLISNQFSYQYLVKRKRGYRRVFDNGRIEEFSEQGRLAKILDKNNNYVLIKYDKNGKITRIEDNFHRKIFFKFNNKGLVAEISGLNKKRARYKYSGADDLIQSRDVEGNVYKYGYDKNHNMVRISYTDGTTLTVAYYGKNKLQNVRKVKDRDGTVTEYFYEGMGKPVFKVSLVVKSKEGKRLSKSSYQYHTKVKKTGEQWTQKLVTVLDGDRTETVYNECCGLPVIIRKKSGTTKFRYDRKGRVTEKDAPFEITRLKYHRKFGKVVDVRKYSKRTKRKRWSKFKYDGRGNLTYAKNSQKRAVSLVYDRNGRIRSMIDQNKRRIDFKYNENSKPIEITDPKLGTIRVAYTNSGEIKEVKSDAGRRIALEVTSAFQNLLDIIRPAGVSLAF